MARNFILANSEDIRFPSIATALDASSNHTALCKIRVPAVVATQRVIYSVSSTITANTFHIILTVQPDGQVRSFIQSNTNSALELSGTLITANAWHTVGHRRTGNLLQTVLDSLITTGTTSAGFGTWPNIDTLDIGAFVSGSTTRSTFHNGDVAELAYWDINLTDSEIAAYEAGMSPLLIRPQNLIFYAPLYGTTQEADFSGTGNVGTLTNTPAATGDHPPVSRFSPFKYPNQATAVKRKEIEHIYREVPGSITQNSTTWKTVIKIGKGSIPALSRWWLYAQGAISSDNSSNQTRVRILNNGVEVLGSLSILVHKTASFVDGTSYDFSKVFDFDEIPGDIELQISNSSTSITLIQSANIFMLRLDKDFIADKDYWYREDQTITDLTTSFGNATSILNTINHPAELLGSGEDVMVVGSFSIDAGGGVTDTQKPIPVTDSPGIGFSRSYSNRSAIDEHLTVIGIVGTSLSSVGTFARNRVAVNNSGNVSRVKWNSLFVLRKNVFNQAVFDSGPGTVINIGTGLEQHIDLSITPDFAGNFVGIASGRVSYEAGSSAGLRNGLLTFRKNTIVTPVSADIVFDSDAEFLSETNALSAMAYFKDLPTSLQDIELMAKGNQANQVNFQAVNVFLFSLLPARHFKVSGIVEEKGIKVSRIVRAFLSSTGEFVGEDVSNPDTGAYEICGLPGGNISVVAYDDVVGLDFNAQIFDKVVPV